MVAASGFTNCACPCIQQALNNVAGKNAQALRRDKVGLIQFLMSQDNLAGVEKIRLDPGTGKRKCVTLNWTQKLCESTLHASITDDCSTGNETYPYCEDISITEELETDNMVFDEDNMRRICAPLGERDELWIAQIVNSQLNAAAVYLDKAVATLALAQIGTFMDGSAIKPIQLFNTIATDAAGPRTLAMGLIQDEFDQAALAGKPNVVGGHPDLNKFFMTIGYGSANAAGQNVAALDGLVNFYYDRFIPGVLGPDEFLVYAPGVAQLLTWNRMGSQYIKKSDTFEHSTLVDPFTGIKYDFLMHYDDCTQNFYIKLQLNYRYWVIPDEGDASCADHYGVNGVFNYESCDDIQECAGASVS